MSPERGAMTMAMAGVVAIVAFLAVAVAGLGMLFAARTQATNAADAAALAAAVATYPAASGVDPELAAVRAARANGARVVECLCPRNGGLVVRTVEVTTAVAVEVPVFGSLTVRSRARAEFDPLRWLGR